MSTTSPTMQDEHLTPDLSTTGQGEDRSATQPTSAETVPELIRTLANDMSSLMRTEIALAKAEIREAADDAKTGVAGMALGAGLASGGGIVMLFAAVYALALVIPLWFSALIVGAAAIATGTVLLKKGSDKVEPAAFVPDRAASSVKKDKAMAERSVT